MRRLNQRGTMILIFIITLPFLILTTMYFISLSVTSYQVARTDQLHTEAQLAADAGADYSIEQLGIDNTWSGTGAEITLRSDSTMKITYTSSITGSSTAKVISVTGKTYWPATASSPKVTVNIYVDMRPVTSGNFSIISGEGGLYMQNSAKIVGGNVFINGEINLANTAQIGLSTAPVNVQVADQICPNPADATYPRVCNAGESIQPIVINNSAHIYGKVQATNQTNGSGMTNTGLVVGSTVVPQPLPTYDRTTQKAAVTTTITGGAGSCGSGTLTWQANTKITGDVSISGKCIVTVKGNVWITGSLSLSNSGQLVVDNALGTTIPNIMIDGINGLTMGNTSQMTSNVSKTGFEIFTFYSTADCSPDCATVTGTNLAGSRQITTISLQNAAAAPNTIFYAYWSQVSIANSGQIGALIGQTIQLANTGTITFGTSTQTGAQTIWVVNGYRRQ
jgi:hypothetical protein